MPTKPITRAELAGIIAKAFGLKENADNAKAFKDVPPSSWYSGFVGALIEAGITSGTTTTTFSPNNKVTREVLVVMLIKAMGLEELVKQIPADAALTDLNTVSEWAKPYVSFAYKVGLVSGIKSSDGTYRFAPKDNADRQAVAMLVFNATTKKQSYQDKAKEITGEVKTPAEPSGSTGNNNNSGNNNGNNNSGNNNGGSSNGGGNNSGGGNNGGGNNNPSTSTLTGNVSDSSGTPISGVKVTVAGTAISATTVRDGNYSLTGVPYGSVNLIFEAANYESKVVAVTVSSATTSVPLVTLLPATTEGNTAVVTGTVQDSNGAPVSGVKVTVVGTAISSVTAADGKYSLAGVSYGSVSLTFEAANYVSKVVAVTVNSTTISVPTVTLLPATAEGNTAVVTGTVQDENGTPVKGVRVLIENTTVSAVTVDDGSFAISDVPYGSYKVIFKAAGYQVVSSDYEIANPVKDLGIIILKKNPVTAKFTVTGTLLGDNDVPLAGVYVYIEEDNELISYRYRAFTNINGVFTITGLPSGTTGRLGSERVPGYQQLEISGVRVNVISDISLEPIHPERIKDSQYTRSVTGSIETIDGQPVEGAKVTVMNLGVTATTDSNGQYTLDNLNYLEFPLIIEAEGYIPLHAFYENERNGANPPVYKLTAKATDYQPATITGTVTGWTDEDPPTNILLEGARVFVTDSLYKTYETTTDRNGRYTISGIDFYGVARIKVYEPYHHIEFFDVNITGPGTFTLDMDISRNFSITRGEIKGNIFDASGNPAKGVRVQLEGGPTDQGTPIYDDGSFYINSIKPGTYQLFMYTENTTTGAIENINTFGPFTVKANKTTNLPDITFDAHETVLAPSEIFVTSSTEAPNGTNIINSQMFGENSSATPIVVTNSAISLVIDCGENSLLGTQDPEYSKVRVYNDPGSGTWSGPDLNNEDVIVVNNRYLVLRLDWNLFIGIYGGTYKIELRGIMNFNDKFTNPLPIYINPVEAP
jgi:protocatechuate 3,4-dioxygenase beta subunit